MTKQFFKYCVVGASGTLIDLASLYLFVEFFQIPLLPAATLSFLLAVTNNFLFNKSWTFKNKSKNYKKLYLKFLFISTVGLGLTLLSMHILVNKFAVWYIAAKIFTSLLVLTWNFLGNKYWTFVLQEKNATHLKEFKHKFSIVIPAYNEENRIKNTLVIINEYLVSNNIDAEIIVVSDGSTDKTDQIVQEQSKKIKNLKLVSYEQNQGKGYAVKLGVESSHGEYILFTDADNSTPIEELEKLYQKMQDEDAQIAIGSRYMASSEVKIKQPRYRIFISRIGNMLINIILIDGVKDTQCGFKLFKHRAAQEVFHLQKVRRFGFDMEALVIANNLGYKVIEVPVSWFNSPESRVRPVKDGLRTLKDLAYIKINLWSGRYSSE